MLNLFRFRRTRKIRARHELPVGLTAEQLAKQLVQRARIARKLQKARRRAALRTGIILPERIVISGSTTLSDWREGENTTAIEGGRIATESIAADRLTARRADLALADLAEDGGLLSQSQAGRFMQRLLDPPSLM